MGIGVRPTGLETAAAALRYWERRQEVTANNLANVNTDGFKGERAFAQLLSDGSTPAISTATDFRAGPINQTGGALDLALGGDQLFVVQTAAGERLSRGGAFLMDAAHRIVDANGHPLLGESTGPNGKSAPIVVPTGTSALTIATNGEIHADGQLIGQLRVEHVAKGSPLLHEGGGLFHATAGRSSVAAADRVVRQGALEESNVESVGSLVDLIAIQRAYASVQKVMSTIDSARGIAVSEIGKPV